MQIRGDKGSWRACPGTVLRGSIAQGQHARRQHSGKRSKAHALERAWARKLDRIDRQEKAGRRLAAKVRRELGLDRTHVWGRGLRLKLAAGQRPKRKSQQRTGTAKSVRVLPAYGKRIVDAKGRIAVFFRIRYMGLKSPKWRAGCTVDHAYYIMRDDALELVNGQTAIVSNMGKDPDEIAGCWKVLEEVERAYRANAKVQYREIVNLSHELTAEQRLDWLKTYCERQFGRYGLPYVAVLHRPDVSGDQRNFHAHICFSTRPVEHTGSYEWDVSEEKVADLARKENLLTMRAEVAAQLNRACRKAGLETRYTHLSYAARKLNLLPQTHAGPARTAAYRGGDEVKAIALNSAVIERNEAVHRYRLADFASVSALCHSMREWAENGIATCTKGDVRAEEVKAAAHLRQLANAGAERIAALHQRVVLFNQQCATHRQLSEQARAARKKALAVRSLTPSQVADAAMFLVHPADVRLTGKPTALQVIEKFNSIRTQATRMFVKLDRGGVTTAPEGAWHLARAARARAKAVATSSLRPSAEVFQLGQCWNAVSRVRYDALSLRGLAERHESSPPDRSVSHTARLIQVAAQTMCARLDRAKPNSLEVATVGPHSALAQCCNIVRTAAAAMQANHVEPSLNAKLRTARKKLVKLRMEALAALSSERECDAASVLETDAVNRAKGLPPGVVRQERDNPLDPGVCSEATGKADQAPARETQSSKHATRGLDIDVWKALSDGSTAQGW